MITKLKVGDGYYCVYDNGEPNTYFTVIAVNGETLTVKGDKNGNVFATANDIQDGERYSDHGVFIRKDPIDRMLEAVDDILEAPAKPR